MTKSIKTPIKIAINGFGRIGRKILRLSLGNDKFEVVAINDLTTADCLAHLLQYDSVHGTLQERVHVQDGKIHVGNLRIHSLSERDPKRLPWRELGVDVVHECTGAFRTKEQAMAHCEAGAKKVIISAPADDPDLTVCMGVNEKSYLPAQHQVLSNASCTTNCLAPLAKVIDENFGIEKGTMLTVHSYTNDQNILDLPHKDLRRARAAALSQIPTTTGAAKAVGLVLPHLKGKIDGLAIRVPTPNVSIVDFSVLVKKATDPKAVLSVFKRAADTDLKGILGVSEAPLVSIDFNGDTRSSIVDGPMIYVVDKNMVKVISWYDNETGFSARMLDLTWWLAQAGW